MSGLVVTRLLANPLGDVAPMGERGDIVRVSDGEVAIYLLPSEYDRVTEEQLDSQLRRRAAGHDRN